MELATILQLLMYFTPHCSIFCEDDQSYKSYSCIFLFFGAILKQGLGNHMWLFNPSIVIHWLKENKKVFILKSYCKELSEW